MTSDDFHGGTKMVCFLDNTESENDIFSGKVAIQFEWEIANKQWMYPVKINFLTYLNTGFVSESDDLFLKESEFSDKRMKLELFIENEKKGNSTRKHRYLRCIYHFYDHKPKTVSFLLGEAYPLTVRSIKNILKACCNFINFCKKNICEIQKFGFRENLEENSLMSFSLNKYNFITEAINLKFYLKETSETRVGKDNVFTDYMVIKYTEYDRLYFVKLMHDFWGSGAHNKEEKTFTILINEYKAWSASFKDRLTEKRFDDALAKFIDFIVQNFNPETGMKFSLLNMDF